MKSSHTFLFAKYGRTMTSGGARMHRFSGDTAGNWFKKNGDFVKEKLGRLPYFPKSVFGRCAELFKQIPSEGEWCTPPPQQASQRQAPSHMQHALVGVTTQTKAFLIRRKLRVPAVKCLHRRRDDEAANARPLSPVKGTFRITITRAKMCNYVLGFYQPVLHSSHKTWG